MKYIKNAVVSPGMWVADWFYETRDDGFVAAAHVYETPVGSYAVVFDGKVACFLLDDETHKPADTDQIMKALAQMAQNGMVGEDLEVVFEDSFFEVGQQGLITDYDILHKYQFSDDQIADVKKRMDDVGNYYFESEVE